MLSDTGQSCMGRFGGNASRSGVQHVGPICCSFVVKTWPTCCSFVVKAPARRIQLQLDGPSQCGIAAVVLMTTDQRRAVGDAASAGGVGVLLGHDLGPQRLSFVPNPLLPHSCRYGIGARPCTETRSDPTEAGPQRLPCGAQSRQKGLPRPTDPTNIWGHPEDLVGHRFRTVPSRGRTERFWRQGSVLRDAIGRAPTSPIRRRFKK